MVRVSRKVPDGWIKYEPIGNVIENTKIFAFKTPLKMELLNKLPKSYRFTTADFIRHLAMENKTIGLIVNVSNTNRFYDSSDFEGLPMVVYKSLPSPGRGFITKSDLVKTFCKVIDEFLDENQHNDLYIGIHSTTGVNRAGYLICRYLIDKGWSSHKALEAFELARGYPIERGSYIQALHRAAGRRILSNGLTSHDHYEQIDEPKRKSRKRKVPTERIEETGDLAAGLPIDPSIMQQFFQIEKEFKKAAGNVTQTNFATPSSYPNAKPSSSLMPFDLQRQQLPSDNVSQQYASLERQNQTYCDELTHTNAEYISDDEDDDYEDDDFDESDMMNINFESMGRIDVKESMSNSQQRRMRRKKRDKMFAVMKKGRFWEINEMRKESK